MDSWKTVPGFCPNTTFTVKGLSEGKRYVFRVKAENMYGVSEPLEGSPIMAKSPFDPPDAPGQPEVTNYSPNSCSLSWTPPMNTGGRPITGKILADVRHIFCAKKNCLGYIIQKRERGGDWVKCNNYPTSNTNFTAQDLREGNRYEFRVLAVNEAGAGKPSKPSSPITAKEQKSKL